VDPYAVGADGAAVPVEAVGLEELGVGLLMWAEVAESPYTSGVDGGVVVAASTCVYVMPSPVAVDP